MTAVRPVRPPRNEALVDLRMEMARRGREPWASLVNDTLAALEGHSTRPPGEGDELERIVSALDAQGRRILRRLLDTLGRPDGELCDCQLCSAMPVGR